MLPVLQMFHVSSGSCLCMSYHLHLTGMCQLKNHATCPSRDGFRVAVAFDRPLPEECLFQQVQRTSALRAVQGGRA